MPSHFSSRRRAPACEHEQDFGLLKEMRDFLQWRSGNAILLAEANVPPDESMNYFGQEGEHLQLMLNFPVNQRLFYALATGDIDPLIWALEQTAKRPVNAQWVQFLRSHDELDLGRLTDEQRQKVFDAFGPEKRMQLYDRGIRRRLAPMLGNNRKQLELAFSLLFSLPGTPMMQYGDEIGMGDNLRLPERECARTPMQWTADRGGGFSRARRLIRPVIDDAVYGYERVNVADQRRDPDSLLNWTERVIRMRKECPEISWGSFTALRTNAASVLALRYDWRETSLLTLHNFADRACVVKLRVGSNDAILVDVFDNHHSRRAERRHPSHPAGAVRLALVSCGRRRQHLESERPDNRRGPGQIGRAKRVRRGGSRSIGETFARQRGRRRSAPARSSAPQPARCRCARSRTPAPSTPLFERGARSDEDAAHRPRAPDRTRACRAVGRTFCAAMSVSVPAHDFPPLVHDARRSAECAGDPGSATAPASRRAGRP